jgi:hypothetical protein
MKIIFTIILILATANIAQALPDYLSYHDENGNGVYESPTLTLSTSPTKTKVSSSWPQPLDGVDIGLLAKGTVLLIVDWGQTDWATWHRNEYYETNKILGKYPSRGKINIYFPICIATNIVGAYLLPQQIPIFGVNIPVRKLAESTMITVETRTDYRNYATFHVGWKI